MIKSVIAVHDRTQLETVFDYPVWPRGELLHRELQYSVEAFFFFPPQMDVTPYTYSKDRFYMDMRPLIRLREPRLSFREMIGDASGRSPIGVLRSFLEEFRVGKNTRISEKSAGEEARLFACSFMGYLLRRVGRRNKELKRLVKKRAKATNADSPEFLLELDQSASEILELLSKCMRLLKEWRLIVKSLESEDFAPLLDFRQEARLVDEYLSYRFRDGLAFLTKTVRLIVEDPLFDAQDATKRVVNRLAACARLEHWYAQKNGYPWVGQGSTDRQIEDFLFRRGALKRRIWSVLFLKIRQRPMFAMQQQVGAMVAAAMAAAWAVTADLTLRFKLFGNANLSPSIGSQTFLIATGLILAYVLKDRIKELGRSYFNAGLFVKIPDNGEKIFFETRDGRRIRLGSIYEYTRFLSFARLPHAVRAMRASTKNVRLENDGQAREVIWYRKTIHLRPKAFAENFHMIHAVHDILRFNVQAFLGKLDDPLQGAEIVDSEGRVSELKMPKVYHLDVVMAYSHTGPDRKNGEKLYDHFRLIVNKKGLFRIERLSEEAS